jgi:ankyrin repeat protein
MLLLTTSAFVIADPPAKLTDDKIREFHSAVGAGDRHAVESMIELYPEIVSAKLPDEDASKQVPPVFTAVDHGQAEVLKILLSHKSPTINDSTHQPALDRAALFGAVSVVKVLLDAGENVDGLPDPANTSVLVNPSHGTPLRDAISCGHLDIAQVMVQHGAHIDIYSAAGLGWTGWVTRQLKDHPEQADVADDWHYTPMTYAVAAGAAGTAEQLLSHGADVGRIFDDGGTFLELATFYGHHDLMAVLLAHGADVNARNQAGETALDFAIKYNQQDAADLLREHGGKRGSELNK